MNNGKMFHALVEDTLNVQHEKNIVVWADEDMKKIIEQVEGVSTCYQNNGCKTRYSVWLDPRYDAEFVKNKILVELLKGS